MDREDIQWLMRRVEALEKRTRHLKVALLAVILLASAGLLTAAALPVPSTIAARSFLLVDATGRMRAALGMAKGDPVLSLYDAEGTPRANMLLGNGVPELLFTDARGVQRVQLLAGNNGPELSFSDARGTVRDLLVAGAGEQGIFFHDEREVKRAALGPAGLTLYNARGRLQVALGLTNAEPSIGFLDAQGRPVWTRGQ